MADKKQFKYDATLLCRGSFPAVMEDSECPCIVEVSVYQLNAVAATSFMLDGSEPLLHFLGMNKADTHITRHELDDLVTVAQIRKEDDIWQH